MNLEQAQKYISKLSAIPKEGESYAHRAASFLSALLPILAWPDNRALRGDPRGLLDIVELIQRANQPSTDLSGHAWHGMHRFLAHFPGVGLSDAKLLVVSEHFSLMLVQEKFAEITMQFEESQDASYGRPSNIAATQKTEAERPHCYRRRFTADGGEYLLLPDDLEPEPDKVKMSFPGPLPFYAGEYKTTPDSSLKSEVEQTVNEFFRSR